MKTTRFALGLSVLMALGLSTASAVPLERDDFEESAVNYDFSSPANNDFAISGGWYTGGGYGTWKTISIDFFDPVSAFGVDVTRTKHQPIAMAIYDSSGATLESYTWEATPRFFIGLGSLGNDIAAVDIFSNNDDLEIDDMIYQQAPQAVPEPTTATLLLGGLLGLAVRRRRGAEA